MRINDTVDYQDATGARQVATITAIAGAGQSGCKTLDLLLVDGTKRVAVPHLRDADEGAELWGLAGTLPAPPDPAPATKAKRKK